MSVRVLNSWYYVSVVTVHFSVHQYVSTSIEVRMFFFQALGAPERNIVTTQTCTTQLLQTLCYVHTWRESDKYSPIKFHVESSHPLTHPSIRREINTQASRLSLFRLTRILTGEGGGGTLSFSQNRCQLFLLNFPFSVLYCTRATQ